MIETQRLRCEPVRIEHAEAMYPVLLDPRIYTYLPERPPPSVDPTPRVAAARAWAVSGSNEG